MADPPLPSPAMSEAEADARNARNLFDASARPEITEPERRQINALFAVIDAY